MARSRVATGMTINDIMNMPMSKFESYSPTAQREITSRLASAANKRLRTLEKSNIQNPATIRLEMSGGKISVRGKEGSELKEEFYRAKQFLRSKFSSKREWKKHIKELQEKYPDDENVLTTVQAYAYYDILQELSPSLSVQLERYDIVDLIADYIKTGVTPKDIINKTQRYLQREYEERQREYSRTSPLSGNALDNIPERYTR